MRDIPILFSAPMVRALLDGSKTQTRRVVKDQSIGEKFCEIRPEGAYFEWQGTPCAGSGVWDVPEYSAVVRSPYGVPGDRLWVRETWQADPPIDDTWASTAWHGCPKDARVSDIPERYRHPAYCLYRANWLHGDIRWRPSIFMPSWASRITLEVTDVRVERLQDISEADAIAEGTPCYVCGGTLDGLSEADCHCFHHKATPSDYRTLWESINGPSSWDLNPFVWVVSFRRV